MDISTLFKNPIVFQGDDWSFLIRLIDYDSLSYTLHYAFKKAGIVSFTISSTSNTDGTFQFDVASNLTSTFQAGLYYVSAYVTDATGKKTTLGQSEVLVKPDISSDIDPRTQARIAYDDIMKALASGAGSDVTEYTVAGETVKKNRQGLLDLRSFWLLIVRREEGKNAIGYKYENL